MEQKQPKKDESNPYVGPIIGICAILFALAFLYSVTHKETAVDISCMFGDIQLKDVRPMDCWYKEFNARFCPIPKDVQCSFNTDSIEDLKELLEETYS